MYQHYLVEENLNYYRMDYYYQLLLSDVIFDDYSMLLQLLVMAFWNVMVMYQLMVLNQKELEFYYEVSLENDCNEYSVEAIFVLLPISFDGGYRVSI